MTTYSVRRESRSKEYLWLVPSHGLEMGFGAAGEYEAHAHKHFVDIIYSPVGLALTPGAERSHIAIVPPRTPFGPTVTGDFFFMKFLLSGEDHVIPDKVTGLELAAFPPTAQPVRLSHPLNHELPWFDPRSGELGTISMQSREHELQVSASAGWTLRITH